MGTNNLVRPHFVPMSPLLSIYMVIKKEHRLRSIASLCVLFYLKNICAYFQVRAALPATLNNHLGAKKDLLWLNFVLSSFQEPSNN